MMNTHTPSSRAATAFVGHHILSAGPLHDVALAVKAAGDTAPQPLMIFDDATGKLIDLDLRGTPQDVLERLRQAEPTLTPTPTPTPTPEALPDDLQEGGLAPEPRGRGRPRLGVVAREVTLLPRHWEWLNAQTGGASVALRKLVEAARRATSGQDQVRQAQEVAYRVMSALGGNLPGFEEATRALFAQDTTRFEALLADWPKDIRAYTQRLAEGAFASTA